MASKQEGIAGLIGSGFSSAGSVAANLFTAAYNANQSKLSRNFQREMWHKANVYNSPSMQMNRFRKAGLNPNLMSGQAPVEASTPASPAGASASFSNPFSSAATDFTSIASLLKDNKLKDKEIEGQQLENEGKEIQNAVDRQNAENNGTRIENENRAADDSHNLAVQNLENAKQQFQVYKAEVDKLVVDKQISDEQLKQEIIKTSIADETKQDVINKIKNEYKLSEKQLAEIDARLTIYALQANGIKWDNELKKQLYYHNESINQEQWYSMWLDNEEKFAKAADRESKSGQTKAKNAMQKNDPIYFVLSYLGDYADALGGKLIGNLSKVIK